MASLLFSEDMLSDVLWKAGSDTEHGTESHVFAVELAQLGVAEEDPVNVFIHLFEPDVLVAENFPDENSALVPTDASAIVHPPGQE